MMLDPLFRDLHVLQKADFLIARLWLNALARRLGFYALAALVAALALIMANLAGFQALLPSLGAVWSGAAVAAADLALAALLIRAGSTTRPGPEIEVAFDLRRMAVEALDADVRGGVQRIMKDPLDLAAHKLLVPAALSLLRGLRARRDPA